MELKKCSFHSSLTLQLIHAQKLVKYNILAYFKKQGFRIRDESQGGVGFLESFS